MRRLLALLGATALVAAVLGLTAAPASAAPNITATSVTLAAGADCDDSSLNVGLNAVTGDWEEGTVTDLSGTVLGEFSQDANWDGYSGVYTNWGNGPDDGQPDGTVLASYALIGDLPFSSATAVEFIVLYRCATDGANEVLLTCFGDLGTCPSTAVEAADALFGAEVAPTQVAPGETLIVGGSGCLYPLAGAILTRDGAGLGVGDVVAPEPDGSFNIELVVPADLAPGPLGVQVDCGYDGVTVQQITVQVEVLGDIVTTTTTTPSTTPTSAPAQPAVVTPRFTG